MPLASGKGCRGKTKTIDQQTLRCKEGFRYHEGQKTLSVRFLLGLYDANGCFNHAGVTRRFGRRRKASNWTRVLKKLGGWTWALRERPRRTNVGGRFRARSAQWQPVEAKACPLEMSYDHFSRRSLFAMARRLKSDGVPTSRHVNATMDQLHNGPKAILSRSCCKSCKKKPVKAEK